MSLDLMTLSTSVSPVCERCLRWFHYVFEYQGGKYCRRCLAEIQAEGRR